MTLPVIIAMQRGTAEQHELLRNVIETGSTDELQRVAAIILQQLQAPSSATRDAAGRPSQIGHGRRSETANQFVHRRFATISGSVA